MSGSIDYGYHTKGEYWWRYRFVLGYISWGSRVREHDSVKVVKNSDFDHSFDWAFDIIDDYESCEIFDLFFKAIFDALPNEVIDG